MAFTDEQAAELKFQAGMGALQRQREMAFNEAAELAALLAVEQRRVHELAADLETANHELSKIRAAIGKAKAATGAE